MALKQECKDITNILDKGKIMKADFTEHSKGLSPEKVFDIISNNVGKHTIDTLSHGDLCLPNILVTSNGKWSLID